MSRFILFICCLSVVLLACNPEAELTTDANEKITIRNKGADIPAFIYGNTSSKTFVVMVHGGPGGNGLEYRDGATMELEKEMAWVYTDQRGQGAAHGHFSNEDVTIGTLVEDLEILVKALFTRYGDDISVFMLGHSWGGTLGTSFVLTGDNQKLLSGWIEVDGAHDLPLLNKSAISMFSYYAKRELDAGNEVDFWTSIDSFVRSADSNNVTDEVSGSVNQYGFQAEQKIEDVTHPDSFRVNFRATQRMNPITSGISGNFTNGALNDEIEATELTNELNKLTIPCSFLWGRYDFVVPSRLGRTAYQSVSSIDKELVIFNHSGHSPMVNEPGRYVNVIRRFIEKHK